MGHLNFQVDGITKLSSDGRQVQIDFSGMPLGKLVALRQLGEGMSAKSCQNWRDAADPASRMLRSYLSEEYEPMVMVGDDFTITVEINDGIGAIYQDVINFFAHENIRVEKPSGIRGLAPSA